MKTFRSIISLAILALAISCSTSWNELFEEENPDTRNKKLMESFGAEDEVFEKFTENKEAAEKVKEIEEKEEKEEERKEVKKTKTAVAPAPQEVAKKPRVKTEKKAKAATSAPVKKTQKNKETSKPPRYPADYPEELKKISEKSRKVFARYQPVFPVGETIVMDINYMGISTGKIVLTTEEDTVIGDKVVHHVGARVKTSDYYSYLYELDDNVDSYVSKENYLPVKYSMIQRESGQDVDDLQLFEHEELLARWFYQRVTDDGKKKKKRTRHTPARFTDPLNVVWFLRGLPMDKGIKYEIPIVNKGKVIILETESLGLVDLDTKIGNKKAYKMKASTTYTGETLKSGDMTFWFSADEKKVFLKFEAKIKIGSISGDIEKYDE